VEALIQAKPAPRPPPFPRRRPDQGATRRIRQSGRPGGSAALDPPCTVRRGFRIPGPSVPAGMFPPDAACGTPVSARKALKKSLPMPKLYR